jgi:hypothetical protein
MTSIPNPWLSASSTATEDIKACPAVQPNTTAGATDFNSPLEPAMAGDAAAGLGLTDDPDPAAARFVLDEDALFEAIEPLPIFLEAPIEALRILARWA